MVYFSSHVAIKVFEYHADFYLTILFAVSFFLYKNFIKKISKEITLFAYIVFYYALTQFTQFKIVNSVYDSANWNTWLPDSARFALIAAWFVYVIYIYIFENELLEDNGERILCIDTALAGSLFVCTARDYIDIYIALEVIAFATYTLIASDKSRYSSEATLKYFLYSAYGSFIIVLAFVYSYFYSGQSFVDLNGVLGFKGLHFDIVTILWLSAFFAKLGIGLFYHWVAPVYQGLSGYAFVFLSVTSKVIALFPFFFLWNFVVVQGGHIFYYYITFSIVIANIFVARDLINEINFRRIAGYSSILNFGLITLGLFNGHFSFNIFVCFVLIYLSGAFSTYIWHSILNTYSDTGQEVTNINKFKFSNPMATFMFKVSLIINSGLPPITLFIYKIASVGMIVSSPSNGFEVTQLIVGLLIIFSNISLYYSYITIVYASSFTNPENVPIISANIKINNHYAYYFGTSIIFITIALFVFTLNIL